MAAGSAASDAAVPPGSLVVRINGKGVHGQTTDAARRMIAHAKRPLKLELLVPSEEEALMTPQEVADCLVQELWQMLRASLEAQARCRI